MGRGRRPIAAPKDCRFTQKGNRLYLHIFSWPFRHIHIDGLAGKVKYAQFLHDASEVHWLSPVAEVDSNVGVVGGGGDDHARVAGQEARRDRCPSSN